MATNAFRDPTTLGRTSIWLMVVHGVFLVLSVISLVAGSGDDAILIIAMLAGLAAVVSGIVFLRWTYVVASNAHALVSHMDVTPGWAVGWYFIPIANLWKPYTSLKEIWEATGPREGSLVGAWWTLHIAAVVCERIFMGLAEVAEQGHMNGADGVVALGVLLDVLLIATNVVAGLLVQRLGESQCELYDSGARASDDDEDEDDCPSCGEPLEPTDAVCPVCGTRVRGRLDFDDEFEPEFEDDRDEVRGRPRNRDRFDL
jgi:hypothetical protein